MIPIGEIIIDFTRGKIIARGLEVDGILNKAITDCCR